MFHQTEITAGAKQFEMLESPKKKVNRFDYAHFDFLSHFDKNIHQALPLLSSILFGHMIGRDNYYLYKQCSKIFNFSHHHLSFQGTECRHLVYILLLD